MCEKVKEKSPCDECKLLRYGECTAVGGICEDYKAYFKARWKRIRIMFGKEKEQGK